MGGRGRREDRWAVLLFLRGRVGSHHPPSVIAIPFRRGPPSVPPCWGRVAPATRKAWHLACPQRGPRRGRRGHRRKPPTRVDITESEALPIMAPPPWPPLTAPTSTGVGDRRQPDRVPFAVVAEQRPAQPEGHPRHPIRIRDVTRPRPGAIPDIGPEHRRRSWVHPLHRRVVLPPGLARRPLQLRGAPCAAPIGASGGSPSQPVRLCRTVIFTRAVQSGLPRTLPRASCSAHRLRDGAGRVAVSPRRETRPVSCRWTTTTSKDREAPSSRRSGMRSARSCHPATPTCCCGTPTEMILA